MGPLILNHLLVSCQQSSPKSQGPKTTDVFIKGNLVGTDLTGTFAIAHQEGISIVGEATVEIGGNATGDQNVISVNTSFGIRLSGSNQSTIQGSLIGTDVTGSQRLGNGSAGIALFGDSGSLIGGAEPGAGNRRRQWRGIAHCSERSCCCLTDSGCIDLREFA